MHLHIIIDSPVFTQSIRQRIHESGQKNTIILVTKSYKEIDVYDGESKKTQNISQVSQWLSTHAIDTLTAHFLSTLAAYLILRLQNVSIVKWGVWGGDFYDMPQVRSKYKGPNQRLRALNPKQRLGYQVINRALRKIDCVFGNLCDLTEIDKTLNLNVNYLQLNHLWDSQRFGILDTALDQSLILIGNSDDPSNNHKTCINQIRQLNSDQDFLIPLSGISNSYTKSLQLKVGAESSAHEVNYIDEFLEKEEYQKQLSRCSHLVYGHYRQQGMATLFAFLRSGKVCYLQSGNPYYQYLLSEGFTLYAIDQATNWKDKLTQEEKKQNKSLIESLFDLELISKQWRQALNYGKLD